MTLAAVGTCKTLPVIGPSSRYSTDGPTTLLLLSQRGSTRKSPGHAAEQQAEDAACAGTVPDRECCGCGDGNRLFASSSSDPVYERGEPLGYLAFGRCFEVHATDPIGARCHLSQRFTEIGDEALPRAVRADAGPQPDEMPDQIVVAGRCRSLAETDERRHRLARASRVEIACRFEHPRDRRTAAAHERREGPVSAQRRPRRIPS